MKRRELPAEEEILRRLSNLGELQPSPDFTARTRARLLSEAMPPRKRVARNGPWRMLLESLAPAAAIGLGLLYAGLFRAPAPPAPAQRELEALLQTLPPPVADTEALLEGGMKP